LLRRPPALAAVALILTGGAWDLLDRPTSVERATAQPLAPARADEQRRPALGHRRARRRGAPVRRVIKAANAIAAKPYRYGGGHGSFEDSGYDCSGSVSYALHGAGLLSAPLDSSGLMSYGEPGPGRHITIYANPGHAYMTVDGRRFDTSARGEAGSRWSSAGRSPDGYVVRHPPGL
jgi:cell wall-associated NlpC family hydrolase